ncbi:NACHT domain-containing protein [Flavobacterium sp. MMS24-S5]|uniref:NACHT domain-containing protein n=1 Tax=Flavobacterium sp. MMS24-S5 TaxID=3416605 RepID=UPI003D0697EE
MEINLSDIKDITTIAKPFIDPLINTIITPKVKQLEQWLKKRKNENALIENYFENKFTEYLNRSYEKFSILNILVFPNQQISTKAIYLPLSISSTKDNKNFKIDIFKKEFIESYQRIVISDTAGMGKSTLMKWIGLSIIEQKISIPILIELKKLNNTHSILDEIFVQLDPIDKSFDKELILKFLELGEFTILLDGFDEIQYDYREHVIHDLKDFISKARKNWYILTSRPDSSLSSFGDFQMFHIKPLNIHESFELIKKYDSINKNKVSEQLIKNIQEKDTQVREFLVNPFLVSLLYKTYTYNKDIPSKKSTFYDDVYGALYKHHDLSKDGFKRNKASGLDIQDFRLILRQLAFDTAKIVKVEYNNQELINHIKEAKNKCAGLDFKESDFIEDIESNVPLFVRDGIILKWAHKSLQDYFAAEFISTSKDKEKIIELIYQSKKDNYLNILDFLYEVEKKYFRKIIIKDLLKNFIFHCNNSYKEINGITKSTIRERQSASYGISYGIYNTNKRITDFKEIDQMFQEILAPVGRKVLSNTDFGKWHLCQIFSSTYNLQILDILGLKNEPIFRKNNFDSETQYKKTLESLPKDVALCLDDNPLNIINSPEYFQLFNNGIIAERLARKNNHNLYLLDYDKSKKLLNKIELEESFDERKDNLDGI